MSYARVDGVSLASQCWGAGPATIVAFPPFSTPRSHQVLEGSELAVGAGSSRPLAWTLRSAPSADVTIERPDLDRFHRHDVNELSRDFAHREIRLGAQIVEWNEIGLGAAERAVLSG